MKVRFFDENGVRIATREYTSSDFRSLNGIYVAYKSSTGKYPRLFKINFLSEHQVGFSTTECFMLKDGRLLPTECTMRNKADGPIIYNERFPYNELATRFLMLDCYMKLIPCVKTLD